LTSASNDFIWEFFYKVINNAIGIINTEPDDAPQLALNYNYKSQVYRAIANFYLMKIYQHTKASDNTKAIPIDLGDFVGENRATVGEVKKLILDDLTLAYNGLSTYSRPSKQEVNSDVVAAYLARYYLTYENWTAAEKYVDVAMNVVSLSSDINNGFDEISL